ncbi:MAG: glutamate formimidoyltransferase [Flavobacteriales bacterium]|nr:glutamate formimidoyltransferase [Flavobacteriales bacterium]MDG2246690.1 glutamate formimidoyltransferase [Flavobacteriales bacterium]
MSRKLVECVPNISEGRDEAKIKAIAEVVETVEGVKLLDVDPGSTTNRTVITFVGEPSQVVDAAFLLIKKASELIDMSKQKGEHPRMGATDVCPFVPVSNVSMEECAALAHALGKRVGEELAIPGYFYESAATTEKRKNLAFCRSGEYEGLDKLSKPEWKPDFGPAEFNDQVKKTGATAIGARDFLVAYNINLNTTSTRRANAIAFDIREAGRLKREGNPITGKKVLDENGEPVRTPGSLKSVKGIGWYIEEYGVAQLSLNLTNINITSVHKAFDEASERARARGVRVTGSEVVGLMPKRVLIEAADHYLTKQERSLGISESEKIKIAVKSLGLDDLAPFNPEEKIIEYMIDDASSKKLVDMSLTAFAEETSSESMAPGGGSISAYAGALGASLATMVANLSAHKRGWDDRWEEFSEWAVQGMTIQEKLIALVDEDTNAFNKIMEAFGLPKGTDTEKEARKEAIQEATKYAIEIPLEVARTAYDGLLFCKSMAEVGNPNSVTDAGVGALCSRSAVLGAIMNVQINMGDLEDKAWGDQVLSECASLTSKAEECEAEVRKLVAEKIG